jgi:hypothetical protein
MRHASATLANCVRGGNVAAKSILRDLRRISKESASQSVEDGICEIDALFAAVGVTNFVASLSEDKSESIDSQTLCL